MIALSPITIKEKTDKTFTITFTDWNNNAIDITWYTIYFVVRFQETLDNTDDSNAVIDKQATITNATNWEAELILTNIDTAIDVWTYVYEISYKKPSTTVHSHYWYGLFTVQYLSNKVL